MGLLLSAVILSTPTRAGKWALFVGERPLLRVVCPHSMKSGDSPRTNPSTHLQKQFSPFKYCAKR